MPTWADRAFLGAGLVGAVLFPATFLIYGAFRPGYNPWSQPISDLALGTGGQIQIANFITYGILTALSAFGWRARLVPGQAAGAYPMLKFITGLALIATGIFHQGMMHNVVSCTSLTATVSGMFVIARRLHQEPGWRGWATYAGISAVLMMGFLAVFGRLTSHGSGGFLEKLATLTGVLFTILLTCRVLSRGGLVATDGQRNLSH